MRVEIRADRKSIAVSGYVNVVGRDSRVLHDKQGPYVEQIMPGAFAKALASGSPVELRWNHQKTLGSTKNKDELELRGWSFGFVKRKDHWKTDEDGTRHRFVDEMELREVSLLDKTPAYIATSVETRDDGDILVEYRVDEPLEEGVDYIRQTERTTEDKTTTQTPEDESVMSCASKTIENYKMKRRM